jgi:hypothetical protein
MKPNRACFNALIDCWAKSGRGTFAARKAEALLREMEELCALGDQAVSPNIVTYNAVLNSWAKSGTRCCGNQAEKYLDRMWKLYHDGDGAIAPNEFSYNTVRDAAAEETIDSPIFITYDVSHNGLFPLHPMTIRLLMPFPRARVKPKPKRH